MKLHLKLACASVFLAAPVLARAQNTALSPTTNFFSVDSYYAPETTGRWTLYRVSGFYEPATGAVQPKLFLLPRITINQERIRYIDSSGTSVTPGSGNWAANVTHVNIPLKYAGGMPTGEQAIAIAAQTGGVSHPHFIVPPATDAAGNPLIFPPATTNQGMMDIILPAFRRYAQGYQSQSANFARWQSYLSRATEISELGLKVSVGGEMVGERHFSDFVVAASGQLPALTVRAPSASIVQQIAQGDFEIAVSYRFRDSNVGTINASFNVQDVLNDYLRESQQAVTSSRSSGMQIFHIGSRRTKVKQSMDQQVERSTSAQHYANTTIVMQDASDAQVASFDAIFFPSLSEQQVITGHLASADSATNAGNPNLAAAHMEYARALQQGAPVAEVDAVGAAAALNNNDWATFLAKGVRSMDTKTNISGTFVRVARENINTSSATQYTDVRMRSVQRAITIIVQPEEPTKHSAELGICDAAAGNTNNFGLLITCVRSNSPAHRAGIMAGHVILRADKAAVATPNDLFQLIEYKNPGDQLTLTLAGMGNSTFERTVTLGYAPPR